MSSSSSVSFIKVSWVATLATWSDDGARCYFFQICPFVTHISELCYIVNKIVLVVMHHCDSISWKYFLLALRIILLYIIHIQVDLWFWMGYFTKRNTWHRYILGNSHKGQNRRDFMKVVQDDYDNNFEFGRGFFKIQILVS